MATLVGLPTLLVVAGCGGANMTSVPTPTTPTVTASLSPTTITPGTSSTLAVAATNASGVTVTGTDGSSYTMAATGGTHAVNPAATTTYTATATGAGGTTSTTAVLTVSASAPAPPAPPSPAPTPTVALTANPSSISTGNTSTLNVVATNATTVTVTGSDGTSYPEPATGGVITVKPTKTTTYTATATGAGGTVSAPSVTVTVTAPTGATVAITANPTAVTGGSTSTLTVVASNDTAVTITGSDGSSYAMPSAGGGQQAVTPLQTTTYTATAAGATGNATAATTITVSANPVPTVTIVANPASVVAGNASTLTVTAAYDTAVTVSGTDGSSYTTLPAVGGTLSVTPAATTTYTATATGAGGSTPAQTTVTVTAPGSVQSIDHVIFMLQENHTFDNYFGMLNPYRQTNNFNVGDDGKTYNVDGIDDKLTTTNSDDQNNTYSLFKLKSTCVDDMTSAWISSYGDVNRYNFAASRPMNMDGFVHNAEGFTTACTASGNCSGTFTDTQGQRVMGYYDENFLNYYYYMASQFAVSNRWFSPVSSKSISNRIATFTGGTTQGLVYDPGNDDHLPQLNANNIFAALDAAHVSWKIYYTVSTGLCLSSDDCAANSNAYYPATDFSNLSYSYQYLYQNGNGTAACVGTTIGSKQAVGDPSNSFCIDPNHIALISQYTADLQNGTLPSFAFIEAGYGNNDEHPGSGQSILSGQAQVASLVNALMQSSSWKDSVFFLSYDEGGGPYEHVPPVPGHSNDKTNLATLGATPGDISSIAVNPDGYLPCVPTNGMVASTNCDLRASDPGAHPNDAASATGFATQIGFRVPNMIISPFTRKHYVSNTPMDHTAVIRFVEDRFIGNGTYLTNRDAAQPNLLEYFDFTNMPWLTPPTPPSPVTPTTLQYDPCTPAAMGP